MSKITRRAVTIVKDWILSPDCGWSSQKRLVALAIADRMNRAGISWPGYDDIAIRAGVHRSTVVKVTKELCEGPQAIFNRAFAKGRGQKSYQYELTLGIVAPGDFSNYRSQRLSRAPSSRSQRPDKVPPGDLTKSPPATRISSEKQPTESGGASRAARHPLATPKLPPDLTPEQRRERTELFVRASEGLWEKKYGTSRLSDRDRKNLRDALKQRFQCEVEPALASWRLYLADDKDWYRGHPPEKWLFDLLKFIPPKTREQLDRFWFLRGQ